VSQEWNCAFKQPETLDTALDSFHRVTHRQEAKLLEESISRPTQTDYAILNTQYYKIGDNNKHDTLHYSIKGHKSNDIPILEDKPPMYILLIDLPLPTHLIPDILITFQNKSSAM
jgi:hypothetical protein